MADTTWDGLPIATDHPRGASVIVRRTDGDVLLLHRAHHGPDFAGDWAWTPPAGARHPGEPILTGALRELAEEAGLTGIEIMPVDLSAGWAIFTADVAQETEINLIDPEHDRFTWVRPSDAVTRLRPSTVAKAMRRALAVPPHDVDFRPLTRDGLTDLVTWQNARHVKRWWADAVPDAAAAEAKYGPRIDGAHPTRVDVLLVDGQPAGFMQCLPLATDPDYLQVAAPATDGGSDAVAIDHAIGDPALLGRGIGTRAIWRYLRDVVLQRFPATRFVVADPEATNTASIRALEKAGFRQLRTLESGEALCVLERARVFGND